MRRTLVVVATSMVLASVLPVRGTARGQDAYVRLPVDSIERLLASEPFRVDSIADSRFEGDRTQRAALVFRDGTRLSVKWARAPRGGDAFNNHPRYEVAAYRLQALFLDEADYVVPPTVVRAVDAAWHRRLDRRSGPTFGDDPWVLVVLQYWLHDVAEGDVFHESRVAWDTTYARRAGLLNVFTVLADQKDANRGNVLIGRDPLHPRFFTVDNGLTFGSQRSDRGEEWRELRVDRLPRATVERLRGITLDDLHAALGVVAQLELRDGRMVAVPPGPGLDPDEGVRRDDGVWQLGLTAREIRDVHGRLTRLLEQVDEGRVTLVGGRVASTTAVAAPPTDGGGPGSEAAGPAPPPADQGAPDYHGEHGLWVWDQGEALRVRWITRAQGAGFLEATVGGDTLADVATRSSTLHAADVPKRWGEGATELVLRYGASDDEGDRHRTVIRLPLARPRPPDALEGVDSLWVVGDVHGRYDALFHLLRNAGVVDAGGRWTGGRAHLVLLGDLFDRGGDVTRTLWFAYGLEGEAAAAGGGVHVVLGNHETMVLTDDLRYVSPEERMLAELHGTAYPRLFDVRRTVLGRWLATRPVALRVDDVLLAHGGLGPAWDDWPVRALNDSAAAYMSEDLFLRWSDSTVEVAPVDSAALHRRIDFFVGPEGVLWYRGYLAPMAARGDGGEAGGGAAAAGGGQSEAGAGNAGAAVRDTLEAMLRSRDAALHVVAHTPLDRVRQFHGGRLVGVDLIHPAEELLLLVRTDEGWERYRQGLDGGPVPLEPADETDGSGGAGS